MFLDSWFIVKCYQLYLCSLSELFLLGLTCSAVVLALRAGMETLLFTYLITSNPHLLCLFSCLLSKAHHLPYSSSSCYLNLPLSLPALNPPSFFQSLSSAYYAISRPALAQDKNESLFNLKKVLRFFPSFPSAAEITRRRVPAFLIAPVVPGDKPLPPA